MKNVIAGVIGLRIADTEILRVLATQCRSCGLWINASAQFFYTADDLMAWNQRQFWIPQFAIDHVKIGAANSASTNAHEQLSPARLWLWDVAQLQRLPRLIENDRAHAIT